MFRIVLDAKPGDPDATVNLGNTLAEMMQLDQAVACFDRVLAQSPALPDAQFNRSLALLARGDLSAGWEGYEWRWQLPRMANAPRFAQTQWRGERASAGATTLLIHAEQGFGDTLQFCRYVPMAAALGWRVLLAVPRPLVRLMRSLPGVHSVVADGETLPQFDVHCPMLSLPRAFGTTLETIPADLRYLRPDRTEIDAWGDRLARSGDRGLRVGLVWAGHPRSHSPALVAVDRRRSLPPERFAPMLDVPGLHLFSLQKDGPAAPESWPITDLMPEMRDFADTAALVANLDLVISVDTAVAHLAASLGKPVWVLERFDSCWRWLTGRRDSPWYPSVRLYRQKQAGDWTPVLTEVVDDLAKLAQQKCCADAAEAMCP